MSDGKTGLQLRSLIKQSGELEISLLSVPTPEPGPDEVVVRVEATPINPSDLGLLTGAADMSTAKTSGTRELPVVTAKVPEAGMKAMAGRQRRRRRRRQDGIVGCGESVARPYRRHDRRRDVCAIPHAPPQRVPAAA